MTGDLDTIFAAVTRLGGERYGGEAVSQAEHALQTAALAAADGASDALVTAALLHDLGHLLHGLGEDAAERGIDARHEVIGAKRLRKVFGEAVSEPVRLHVDAKRYLCFADKDYFAGLSPASVRSLGVQGGPFDETAARAFLAHPFAEDAVRLRRWDDLAKERGLTTPPLAFFRKHAEAAAALS